MQPRSVRETMRDPGVTPDTLQQVYGGFSVDWKKVGEYAAPVLMSNPSPCRSGSTR